MSTRSSTGKFHCTRGIYIKNYYSNIILAHLINNLKMFWKYTGKWYEYAKYPFIFELGGKCITATYTENSNDGSVEVVNSMVSEM